MSNKKYLIFDLDDTILDFKKGEEHGLSEVFQNYPVPDVLFESWRSVFRKVNREVWKQIEEGASAKELLDTRFSKTYQTFGLEVEGALLEQYYRGTLDKNFFILEGARECLEKLKNSDFILIAGTNGKATTQRSRLKGTGLDTLFDDVFISDEIGMAKPDKRFFDYIIQCHKEMTVKNTFMIGDSLRSDIQGAINAGLRNIWFNPFGVSNKTSIHPDYEAKSFAEIEKIIIEVF